MGGGAKKSHEFLFAKAAIGVGVGHRVPFGGGFAGNPIPLNAYELGFEFRQIQRAGFVLVRLHKTDGTVLRRSVNCVGVFDIGKLAVAIAVSNLVQLSGRHGEHLSAGFELLVRDRKGDPELIALPLGIDACSNNEARFDFLFRLQEADVVDRRLVVERESPAFPTVIDSDCASVDGFDNTMKYLSLLFLGGKIGRCKGQADNNKAESQVGIHGIVFCDGLGEILLRLKCLALDEGVDKFADRVLPVF